MSAIHPEAATHPLKRVVSASTIGCFARHGVLPAMQLADCSSTAPSVHDRASQAFSGQNQKAYLRLKLALSLNLRRQIFLAVCDDLALRNRLAARLYAELGYPPPKPQAIEPTAPVLPLNASASIASPHDARLLSVISDDREATPSNTPLASRLLYPRLVSLNLNLSDPNPMVQIAEWLAQYPPPKGSNQRLRSPAFQILGTERLTRQPALAQKRFLNSLQQVEHYLSCLESPLLLWLPRPWLNAVQQSAPNFWNWHTALFEFEGDPTPVASLTNRLHSQTANSASPSKQHAIQEIQQIEAALTEAALTEAPLFDTAVVNHRDRATTVSTASTIDDGLSGSSHTAAPASNASTSPKEDLWDILTHDLALLNTVSQPTDSPSKPLDAEPLDSAAHSTTSDLSSIAAAHSPVPPVLALNAHPKAEQNSQHDTPVEVVEAASIAPAIVEPAEAPAPSVTATADTPSPNPPSQSPPSQSQAALELADLILAVVAEEGESHTSQNSRVIEALQQIEQLHLQQAPRATLLAAYQNLGSLCRDRIEQGNASSRYLLLTICVYEQTLQWLDDSSLLWSDVLNDIGNLCWMLARHESVLDDSLIYLDQAIAAYQQALVKTNPDTRPHSYAMIQNNLGSAYGDMARFRSPTESLEQSVTAYETALRYRQLHDDPARYAATQNNLGTAYWNLAQHQQPVRRLKQSIASYFEALRYYSPDCEPMHYAMIQNNLGTAYWNLSQQPQANLGVGTAKGKALAAGDLLQRAIAAYQAALVYRTLSVAPASYAATQNNLGTAYWQLATLSDSQPSQCHELLQQAIAAYKEAIAAVECLSVTGDTPILSFDPAATHNNLGLAYYQLAIDKHSRDSAQRSARLEAALHHHLQALQAWQAQPELYKTVFSYVLQTMRAFHDEFGTKGQTLALSQVPANLLPDVLKQL